MVVCFGCLFFVRCYFSDEDLSVESLEQLEVVI